MGTINITGTGGIIEGNLGTANVDVNLDPVVKFDSNDDKITTGNLGSLGQATSLSSFAWVKLDATPSTSQYIWSTLYQPCNFVFSGATGLRFQGKRGDTDALAAVDSSGPFTFQTDVWYHVGFTYDNSSRAVLFYINGVQYAGGTFPAALKNVNTDLILGNYGAGTNMIQGNLADVKIFNSVVSETDAKILAAKINQDPNLTSANANVIGWWKINEGSASIADFTNDTNGGTDHNGTLANGTWQYDQFYVDVYDGYDGSDATTRTTTDGTFTVTKGKVEGLALSSVDFNGTDDSININNDLESWVESAQKTFAVWIYNDGNTSEARVFNIGFSDPNSTGFAFGLDNGTDNKPFYFLISTSGASLKAEFGDVHPTSTWMHYAIVTDGANDQAFVYQNGVLKTTVSSVGEISQATNVSAKIGKHWASGQNNYFEGKIKDVRLYDYNLSDDQVSSLYSGSYPQTPLHWWKLDEGYTSGTTANTSGAFEDSGTGTDYDAQGTSLVNASCVNGTLDLDGNLTIAANGTLSAPRGTFEMEGASSGFTFKNLATNGFIHNNGTVDVDGSTTSNPLIIDDDSVATTKFYNLTISNDHQIRTQNSITVENNYTLGSSTYGHIFEADTLGSKLTFTMGTSTEGGIMTLNAEKLEARNDSQTFAVVGACDTDYTQVNTNPFNFDGDDDGTWELKNLNFNSDITTSGAGLTLRLMGDCEFNAVTVSSGDTLQISDGTNGQRATFGGGLWVRSGGILTDDGDSSLIHITGTSTLRSYAGDSSTQWAFGHHDTDPSITLGNTDMIISGGAASIKMPSTANDFARTVLVSASGAQKIDSGVGFCPQNLIAGSEVNTHSSNNNKIDTTNLTIPTGGILTANGSTLTVAGDFNVTGGLLGKSCLSLDRDNTEYARSVAHADFDLFNSRNAMTVEMWFKTGYTGSNHQHMVNLKDNDGNPQVMQMFIDYSTGKVNARVYTSGTTSTLVGASDIRDSKWHHAAIVYDGDYSAHATIPAHKLYIDGKLEAEELSSGAVYAATNCEANIGVRYSLNQGYFHGEIDEVRMFAAAKTTAQIRADMFKAEGTNLTHFNSQADGSTDGLVGRWHCNDGSGSTLTCSNTNLNMTIYDYAAGPAAYEDAWAGAGTFTRGSSKIHMSGANGTMTVPHNFYVHDLQVADSGETTTVTVPAANDDLNIDGTLTLGGGTFTDGSTDLDLTIAGSEVPVMNGSTFSAIHKVTYWATTAMDIVSTTYNKLQIGNGRIYTAAGDIIVNDETQLFSDSTFRTDGHNLTTKTYDNAGTSTIEKASTLTFSDLTGCGFGSSTGTLNLEGSFGASFDGLENEMTADSNPLPGSGPFTYTCWFKTRKTGIHNGIADFTASSSRGMFTIWDNNKPFIYLGSNNYRYWDSISSYLDGGWHHLSLYIPGYAQADASSATLHIDGNLINHSAVDVSGAAQQPTMAQLKIGGGYSSNNNWDGNLADVRIFTKALTAGNLTTLRSINPSNARADNYPDSSNAIGATHWWKLNESNFPSDDAADSVGSIDCSVTGAVPNRVKVTSSAGGNPTNYWNFYDHAMPINADYNTFEKFHRYESGGAAIDIDNCTMQTSVSGYYNWTLEAGATITSFTNNTINVTGNYGFQCNKTHSAFDNITVNSSGDYCVIATGGRLEFTNSNFSIGNVRLSNSSSHVVSKTHNDTANLYEICAGSGGLTYSTIVNTPDIPTAVIRQRTGILTFNSDNKEFDSYNVFSGATIRVTDGKDMYLNTFDNDGTWVQTAGYGGEIHVGDFSPFDSGDVIDDTDFVDTGFHDTSHYLEMDL